MDFDSATRRGRIIRNLYVVRTLFAEKRIQRDFDTPEDILTAVDVYVQYKRKRAAIELLEAGLTRYPDHPGLRARLAALQE